MSKWRCPNWNKKQGSKELLKLGHCNKCGREHTVKDFLAPNYNCPVICICNDSDDCEDEDWENCGSYCHIRSFVKDVR